MRQSCKRPLCSTGSSGASTKLSCTFLENRKCSCHLLCCLWLPWHCESLSLSVSVQMHPLGQGGCVLKTLWRQRSRILLWGGTSGQLALSTAKLFLLTHPALRCPRFLVGLGVSLQGRALTARGRVSWLPEEGAGAGSQVCRRSFPTASFRNF